MYGTMTKNVSRKAKPGVIFFTRLLLILSIVFMLVGIMLSRGALFVSTITVILYWLYSGETTRDYEYHLENGVFSVDVIKGKRSRKREQELNLDRLEVLAPHWHSAVGKYRKNGGSEKLKKYDYTSYNDDIPYYTMIIRNGDNKKIKLLLDLDEEWMRTLYGKYPSKVIID